MSNCYLCGADNATQSLNLKSTFTAHSLAKDPRSTHLCDRCNWAINLRAYYYNPNKNKFSLLFSRNWSWLYAGEGLIYPKFAGEREGFPIVSELPTRSLLRDWLINPPNPPFTIAIAESGQKHILFLAQEAQSREIFPVLFELDILYINRSEFVIYLEAFEGLLALGATKTEIGLGRYKNSFLLKNLDIYLELDQKLDPIRGGRLIDLISYVAQKPVESVEPIEPVKPVEPIEPVKPVESIEPVKPVESVKSIKPVKPKQLSLF